MAVTQGQEKKKKKKGCKWYLTTKEENLRVKRSNYTNLGRRDFIVLMLFLQGAPSISVRT